MVLYHVHSKTPIPGMGSARYRLFPTEIWQSELGHSSPLVAEANNECCTERTISKALFQPPLRLPDDGTHGVPKYLGEDFVHLLFIHSSACKDGFMSPMSYASSSPKCPYGLHTDIIYLYYFTVNK